MAKGRKPGFTMSQETKDKISTARRALNLTMSDEQKADKKAMFEKMWKNVPKTPEQREKMSITRTGIKDTDATKQAKAIARSQFIERVNTLRHALNINYKDACLLLRNEHVTDGSRICPCNPEVQHVSGSYIYVHKDINEIIKELK